MHIFSRTEMLNGAIEGMGSVTLQKVDAVSAIEAADGRVHLIGVGNATWDSRDTQHESLINSHYLRASRVEVNDTSKIHGSDQCIK